MTLNKYVWSLLLLSCCPLLACGGTRTPAPSKSAVEPTSESTSTDQDGAALVQDEDESPAEETLEGETFDMAEAAEEAPAEEEADEGFSDRESDAEREKKERPFAPIGAVELLENLETKVAGLDEALKGEELSCGAAGPFRDAICAIADRICELGPVSEKCVNAKASCVKAKKRFADKCE